MKNDKLIETSSNPNIPAFSASDHRFIHSTPCDKEQVSFSESIQSCGVLFVLEWHPITLLPANFTTTEIPSYNKVISHHHDKESSVLSEPACSSSDSPSSTDNYPDFSFLSIIKASENVQEHLLIELNSVLDTGFLNLLTETCAQSFLEILDTLEKGNPPLDCPFITVLRFKSQPLHNFHVALHPVHYDMTIHNQSSAVGNESGSSYAGNTNNPYLNYLTRELHDVYDNQDSPFLIVELQPLGHGDLWIPDIQTDGKFKFQTTQAQDNSKKLHLSIAESVIEENVEYLEEYESKAFQNISHLWARYHLHYSKCISENLEKSDFKENTLDVYRLKNPIEFQLQLLTLIDDLLAKTKTEKHLNLTLVRLFSILCPNYDRIDLYQFDPEWNGHVVEELVMDPSLERYLELFFPPTDIPVNVRNLYKKVKMLVLEDAYEADSPLVDSRSLISRSNISSESQSTTTTSSSTYTFNHSNDEKRKELLNKHYLEWVKPLNLSSCFLRAIHPIHKQFVRNMKVRSSFSVAISSNSKLWGLISLHAIQPNRILFHTRNFISRLSFVISKHIEKFENEKRIEDYASQKILGLLGDSFIMNYPAVQKNDIEMILNLFCCDISVLSLGEMFQVFSRVEGKDDEFVTERMILEKENALKLCKSILKQLQRDKILSQVVYSRSIAHDFPHIYEHLNKVMMNKFAGFLYIPFDGSIFNDNIVPLSHSFQQQSSQEEEDKINSSAFLLLLRKEAKYSISWAGDPSIQDRQVELEKSSSSSEEGHRILEPRKSFQLYQEFISNKCLSWSINDIRNANLLSTHLSKLLKLRNQKERAESVSTMRSIMLGSLAHEVKTPLNAIINYLHLAKDMSSNHEDLSKLLDKSLETSESLVRILNHLLKSIKSDTVSKAPLMGGSLTEEPFDISVCIEKVLQMADIQPDPSRVTVTITIDPNLPTILCGDVIKIQQILCNLYVNAVKHTHDGFIKIQAKKLISEELSKYKTISNPQTPISTFVYPNTGTRRTTTTTTTTTTTVISSDMPTQEGSSSLSTVKEPIIWVKLMVQDSGDGISKQNIPIIFKPFEQLFISSSGEQTALASLPSSHAPNSFSSGKLGYGLGLSIVSQLLHEMNGEIQVETELNQGSTFSVLLPLHIPTSILSSEDVLTEEPLPLESDDKKQSDFLISNLEKKILSETKENRGQEAILEKCRILISEDDPIAHLVIKKHLDPHFDSVFVVDGQQCYDEYVRSIHSANEKHYDVILTDLEMPGCSGFFCAKRIREFEKERGRRQILENQSSSTGSQQPSSPSPSSSPSPVFKNLNKGNMYHVPIIAMSSHDLDDVYEKCIVNGINGYISKPIEYQKLIRMLKNRDENLFSY